MEFEMPSSTTTKNFNFYLYLSGRILKKGKKLYKTQYFTDGMFKKQSNCHLLLNCSQDSCCGTKLHGNIVMVLLKESG